MPPRSQPGRPTVGSFILTILVTIFGRTELELALMNPNRIVIIALGSNLGDSGRLISQAMERLREYHAAFFKHLRCGEPSRSIVRLIRRTF